MKEIQLPSTPIYRQEESVIANIQRAKNGQQEKRVVESREISAKAFNSLLKATNGILKHRMKGEENKGNSCSFSSVLEPDNHRTNTYPHPDPKEKTKIANTIKLTICKPIVISPHQQSLGSKSAYMETSVSFTLWGDNITIKSDGMLGPKFLSDFIHKKKQKKIKILDSEDSQNVKLTEVIYQRKLNGAIDSALKFAEKRVKEYLERSHILGTRIESLGIFDRILDIIKSLLG